jgi:xanthine dehydrogenase accessory factor
MRKPVVLIKGGGDLASGVAYSLAQTGVGIVMTELAQPKMVRREVSFGNAVYKRDVVIEGVRGKLCASVKEAFIAVHSGRVAVLIDPTCSCLEFVRPAALVDAVMAKRNTGTRIYDAPVVIAVGPGFEAGRDCHAVVESLRGENMGKVLYSGRAAYPTGKPAEVKGYSTERVLRAPAAGVFRGRLKIGDAVEPGVEVARIETGTGAGTRTVESTGVRARSRTGPSGNAGKALESAPAGGAAESTGPGVESFNSLSREVVARISGVVRGLLADDVVVREGQKVGDIDPTGQRENCFRISDKARAVGEGALEAIRRLAPTLFDKARQ